MSDAPPPALAYDFSNCSLGRAMEILGERWTVVVLREIFNGIRRFADIQGHTGIPRQVLVSRLGKLVEHGILVRAPYREPGHRERHEYRLTPRGLELSPILVAITRWGDRHLASPEGPPVDFVHQGCGARVDVKLVCERDHVLEGPRELTPRPGPGARLLG